MNAITMSDANATETNQSDAAAYARVTAALENLNQAVAEAVTSGLTVEIKRTCRCHDGGAWGDQMAPVVNVTRR